jgi:hypothetical protein
MSSDPRRPFLRHFGRAEWRRQVPDLADMGTAFALDGAMDQPQYASLAPGELPPSRQAVPVAPWRLWLGRKLGA